MKKLIWVALVAICCGNAALANVPSQDKPVSKTTTVKKSTPTKVTATTKTVHTKHVKKS